MLGDNLDSTNSYSNFLWVRAGMIGPDPYTNLAATARSALGYERHGKSANVAFVDGHVGSLKASNTPSWSGNGDANRLRPWFNNPGPQSTFFPYADQD